MERWGRFSFSVGCGTIIRLQLVTALNLGGAADVAVGDLSFRGVLCAPLIK